MSLLRVDASLRVEGSFSRELGDIVEQAWRDDRPGGEVVRRDVGLSPLRATALGDAITAGPLEPADRTPDQREAVALAETLGNELIDASALLLAVPFYNFGISQHIKSWIDLIFTHPAFYPGGPSPIPGKPAVLAVARGGAYGPGTPRDGWDHGTPWIRRILQDVWGMDLQVVEIEFTLAGVSPGLDEFKDLAAELRTSAHERARDHGKLLARGTAA